MKTSSVGLPMLGREASGLGVAAHATTQPMSRVVRYPSPLRGFMRGIIACLSTLAAECIDAGVPRVRTELFLDSQQLVVLRHPLAASRRSRFDLTGA